MKAHLVVSALSFAAMILPLSSQTTTNAPPTVNTTPPSNNGIQSSSVDPKIPSTTVTKVVPTNEARFVGFAVFLNPDCSPNNPVTVRIMDKPSHGTVTTEKGEDFTHYNPSSPLGACNNKRVPGIRVRYEAGEDYVGDDTFRMLAIGGDGTAFEYNMRIIIR